MGGFTCQIWRGNAVCCLATVRPGKSVFHQICFSLASSPKEYRKCSPETPREAWSWKLYSPFLSNCLKHNPQVPWQHLAHSPLLKPDGKHSMVCLCLRGWQWALERRSAATLNEELVLLCMSLNISLHSRKPLMCLCMHPKPLLWLPLPLTFCATTYHVLQHCKQKRTEQWPLDKCSKPH